MTYSVQNTDGSKTINVAASQVNSSFSVALVGRNVSGYGQYFVQNSIRHLENFASSSAPSDDVLLTGQIWYDKNEDVMRVYDGSGWRRMSITVSAAAPSGGVDEGTAYFDTVDDKLKIHNGTAFVDSSYAGKVSNEYTSDTDVGSPNSYGTRLRTMYIPDTSGVYHAVLALVYVNNGSNSYAGVTSGESVMAVFSDHAQFTIDANVAWKIEGLSDASLYTEFTDSDGIGSVIKPGMNLRQKYSSTAIALANVALQADSANGLLTGLSSNPIDANLFIHTGRSYIPATTDNETLGSASQRFSELYINTIKIGDPASGAAQYIKKSSSTVVLDIGESAAPVDNIYATNITLANGGGISGLNVESFGSSGSPIDEAYISNVVVGSNWVNSLGFHGDLRDTNGNVIIDVSAGAGAQLGADQTFSGENTFSDNLLASGNPNLGTSSNRFGTMFTNTFNGVDLTLSNSATVSGSVTAGNVTASAGTVTGGTLTDGVMSISSGVISSGVSATFSGNVDGNYFLGTATSAQYADLAEIYSSDSEYEAGTVVKLGGEAEVTQTESHADVDVFGVVSSNPAYLMNSEAEGVPVALAGRVPVKVVGKVAKGERLVSSDVPGVAWALGSDEYDCRAVIGRALEAKEDGDVGVIEAVIGVK